MLITKSIISTLSVKPLQLVELFTYISSNISSTESHVNIRIAKEWTAIDGSSIKWKLDLSHKIKQDFFPVVAVLILLYRFTTWIQARHIGKKLHGNYTKCYVQFWTNLGDDTLQESSSNAIYLLSSKHSTQSKDDMLYTTNEIRTNAYMTFSDYWK